jgi:hypothetical protein
MLGLDTHSMQSLMHSLRQSHIHLGLLTRKQQIGKHLLLAQLKDFGLGMNLPSNGMK